MVKKNILISTLFIVAYSKSFCSSNKKNRSMSIQNIQTTTLNVSLSEVQKKRKSIQDMQVNLIKLFSKDTTLSKEQEVYLLKIKDPNKAREERIRLLQETERANRQSLLKEIEDAEKWGWVESLKTISSFFKKMQDVGTGAKTIVKNTVYFFNYRVKNEEVLKINGSCSALLFLLQVGEFLASGMSIRQIGLGALISILGGVVSVGIGQGVFIFMGRKGISSKINLVISMYVCFQLYILYKKVFIKHHIQKSLVHEGLKKELSFFNEIIKNKKDTTKKRKKSKKSNHKKEKKDVSLLTKILQKKTKK